jgi:glycosyltransferase involved in cell wall biosynthesis
MSWLIVAGDLTPLGGMDAANHALARHLASRGEVHLVTHRAWPDLAALPTVTVHPVWRPFNRHVLGSPLLSRTGQAVWRRLRASGAHAIVNGGNCRIAGANWVHYLHAANPPDGHSAGSLARRATRALSDRRDLAAERAAIRAARVVICNSRRTRDDVVERIGVDPSRARVIYYGGDPVRFSPVTAAAREAAKAALSLPAARPLVGFVGALGDRRKAFDTVFAAWCRLCGCRNWDADLIVVGEGAELPAWRLRAQEAGIGDRIRFAGFRTDVPEILAALDALVHPARYEAYGLSVREALSRGVPAIVSASAGVAEEYPPELGELLIADPNDPGELAAKLLAWRRDMERFRSAIQPLSDRLRRHTWDAMAGEIAECVLQAS